MLMKALLFFYLINPLWGQANLVTKNLKELEVIRVFLEWGPGKGNQASTFNFMKRLRLMGFEGTFEVIADEKESQQIMKLKENDFYQSELQETKNNPGKIKLFTWEQFTKMKKNEPVQVLGISGGGESFKKNLADLLGVKLFIQVGPFEWGSNRSEEHTSSSHV